MKLINIRDTDSEFVEGEFSDFCKNQQLKKALLSSVDLLKAGDYDSIKMMIENALRAGQDKNLGHEYEKTLKIVIEKNIEQLSLHLGLNLMSYYRVDLEMVILVLYLVIQEVVNLGH